MQSTRTFSLAAFVVAFLFLTGAGVRNQWIHGVCAVHAAGVPGLRAETVEENAFGCFSVSDDGSSVTVQNGCSYAVHYYWVAYSQPNLPRNGYVESGASDTFSPPGGRYKVYACNALYHVVDPSGHVINHLVDDFSCIRG